MRERRTAKNLQLNSYALRTALRKTIVVMAFFVVLGVFWCLKLTGITMACEAFCGMDEHVHTDECPSSILICTEQEHSPHIHDESCILRELVCGEDETPPHTHVRAAWNWN